MLLKGARVALVHDWLTGMRGGERVLEAFAEMFPSAPIYTLLHKQGSVSPSIESHSIRTSMLQQLPMAEKKYRYYLPLLPKLVERIKIEPVDLVLSTSSCVAKGIIPPVGAVHASYVHSPMRYIYDRYDDYFAPGRAGIATRTAMRMVRPYLQKWDRESTDRVHSLVANSYFIADRIRRIYGRASRVIHPPVDVGRFAPYAHSSREDYYLIVSALVPYKNVDIAIEAFRGLDRKLVVAGSGPMFARLAANCPKNVELRGWVSDDELPDLVGRCRAFLFPNVEDFGIAPVEAMAAGRPIIALGEGGALDSIRDLDRYSTGELDGGEGPTGVFFENPTPAELAKAVRRFERAESAFDSTSISRWAANFDTAHFKIAVTNWLSSLWEAPARRAA